MKKTEKTEKYRQEAEESYKSLQFTDDFLFCKILTENEDITKELLELILGRKICQNGQDTTRE